MDFLETVRSRLANNSLVKEIDQLARGHVRIETALLYPDGGSIDVFVQGGQQLLEGFDLTDFGQTTAWLLNVQVKPWESKKRQRFLEDAIRLYDVHQNGGALEYHIEDFEHLQEGVVRLAQACFRVSDLTFTRRSTQQSIFSEEVEEIFVDNELRYEPNVEVIGRYGKPVKIDYRVFGRKFLSSVLTLSAGNPTQAHIQSNELFRRWYDLGDPKLEQQHVTIYDDRKDAYKDEDLKRLNDLSILLPISDRPTVRDVLAA
jgi:hypothetical protein